MPTSGRSGPRASYVGLLLIALLAVSAPRRLAAQIPTPTIDTSAAADSARDDSLRHDATDRLLTAADRVKLRVPVLPDLGADGPRALGSRIVLDRRSIAWHTAVSVADLLMDVPGVYIWRGGWHGRPVYANYRGRGATSIDWVVDGVPFIPLGPDSVGVDPGSFALVLFERVEIERWPSGLRVYLYTPQNPSLAPRSRVGIATGSSKIARFQGDLEYRWKNGLGLTGATEVFDAPGPGGSQFDAHLNSALWRAEYVPHPGIGVQVQFDRIAPLIRYFKNGNDTIGDRLRGARNDMQVRLFARRGDEAHHLEADLLYVRSKWDSDTFRVRISDTVVASVSDNVHQETKGGGLVLSLRQPRWGVTGSGWLRDGWTPVAFRGEAGYVPFGRLSLDGEVVHEQHAGDRVSHWAGARGALTLPLGFGVEGAVRSGSRVIAPSIAADTAQDISERSVRGSWGIRPISFFGGLSSTAAFQPRTFQPYLQIDSLRSLARTTWVDLGATLRPTNWLTLDGWYSDPKGPTPQGLPPTHSVVRGEIRSKFLREYPSGIFELRLAAEMETWGHGVIGTDSVGAPIPLRGATYYRLGLDLRLSNFQFFWDRVNVRSTRLGYVPGFIVPGLGQTFGMRWEFSN